MATKYPPSGLKDRIWIRFTLAGCSCICAALVTNPIDIMKTRMQMTGERGSSGTVQYKGVFRTASTIVQKETWRGLYKGVSASCLRESSYSSMRLGGYDVLKSALMGDGQTFITKLLSGMISGYVGASLTTPTDLIKVRMQADEAPWGQKRRYSSLRAAFREVYKKGGIRGLYDGWGPNASRAAVLTGVQISTYDHCKYLVKATGVATEGLPLHIGSSIVAGLCASLATAPFDLVKTRIMRSPGLYTSSFHCARVTIQHEGVLAMWKGFFAQWIRIGPHTLTSFIVLEQLRRLIGLEAVGV